MATNKPSDADIFDDDDDPSPAGGGSGGSSNPPSPPPKAGAKPKTSSKKPAKKAAPKPHRYKIGGKDVYDDLAFELKNRLVKAPKVEREKIAAAMAGLAGPGVSVAERLALKKVIADANKELKKIEKDNKEYVKNQQRFQAVQSDTGSRLTALQEYMQKSNGQISESERRRLRAMEMRLLRAVQNSDLSDNDHEQNARVVKELEKLEKLAESMPKELQKRFDEIDEKTSVLITAQQEAAAMVAETNAKMKDFGKRMGMGILDFMGIGSFNLGNAVRGVGKAVGGAKAVGRGVGSAASYLNAQRILHGAPKQTPGSPIGGLLHTKDEPVATAKPTSLPQQTAVPPAEYDPNDPLTHPRKKRGGATLRSPTQNADELKKIEDQLDKVQEAEAARAKIDARTADMEKRLESIVSRHDGKSQPKPGKTAPVHGKKSRNKAKNRFGAVMEARRAAAGGSAKEAADVQEPMIELRNGKHDPDKVGAFRAGTMEPMSIADATKAPAANDFDPDKVGAFKAGTMEPVSVGSTVKPIRAKPKLQSVKPRQIAPAPVASQQEEDSRKSSDYQEDSLREAQRLNEILDKHAEAQARFNDRLLGQLRGRSKPAAQSSGLGKTISDLASSIGGLGKMLPGMMGMLGKGLAIAGAWEAGQYIGGKIYESQSENIGKGVDATVSGVTHLFGGKTDDDKIQEMLKAKPGSAGPRQAAKGKVTDQSKGPSTTPASVPTPQAGAGGVSGGPQTAQSSDETAPTPSSAVSPVLDDKSGGGQATPVSLGGGGPSSSQNSATVGESYPGSGESGFGGPQSGGGGKDGSAGGKVRDFMGKLFSKSSGVDTDGIHPKMQDTLVKMADEYYQSTGKKLNFNSAFRSLAEQEKLFRTKPPGMAGKPGSSLHNFGLAVDIPSVQANELDKLGLLGKYGFVRPIANEKWHIQPAGISVAAAKAGIFSADAPTDQGQPRTQTASAQQQAPGVTNANYDMPKGNGSGGTQTASGGSASPSGGTAGGTRVSAASIPTFDHSDGVFLALNTGII